MKFTALDLETKSLVPDHDEYALQPWRAMSEEAKIVTIFKTDADKQAYEYHPGNISRSFDDSHVWTWNGIFDIAWLLASGVDCSRPHWLDAMSAAKRVFRSQCTDHPSGAHPISFALDNMAKELLRDWSHYKEFIDVKSNFSFNTHYLKRRCALDTEATHLIGLKMWELLTPQQQKSFLFESEILYLAAQAQVIGTRYDSKRAFDLQKQLVSERLGIIDKLKLTDLDYVRCEKLLGSNDRLAELLYDEWKIPFDEDLRNKEAKTNRRPVNLNVLTFLAERYGEDYAQIELIKRYRKLKSLENKFITGAKKTQKYLGSDIMRHVCKPNATYTGRTTYASKS